MTFFERPIGIDLGTTNSEVALLEPSEREIFVYQDRHKRKTVPSAVAWDGDTGSLLVGRAARMRRGRDPGPIESIKRKMGQNVTVSCGPHELKPEEVSAKILSELAARMREFLSEKSQGGVEMRVQRAVITVPAYFDAPQVEATRRAAELASLDPIGILQEPTAAAIYHTWKRKLGDGVFLVYDFGGGTFDVSILRCVGGEYQVLAIDGDNYLGGDDLDRRYAEHLRKELSTRGYALDLDVLGDESDRRRFTQLVHLAQEIKESLSTRDVVHVAKQAIVDDKTGELCDFEAEVSRSEYEKVVADLIETTITCAERALEQSQEKASIGIGEIDNVILVGGSTRVPLVIRRVTEALCVRSRCAEPLQDEVDTCVALGAAIHAAQIGGLRIGDEHAQVLFTSALVAKQSPLKLAMRIEQAPAGTKEVAVMAAGEVIASAPVQVGAVSPMRLAVPLSDNPEQPLTLTLRGEAEALAELPFAVYRGDVRPRASALSRPAVVAKDLSVEVVRAGRRDRRVLLPRGTGLPMKVSQTFFTGDQSGAVVLRLLQGRMPIKTLVLQIPGEIPTGTAVELDIRCDEAMRLEARANVAGHELWATIEPPEAPRFDPKGDVESLLEEAEDTRRALWGVRGELYRRDVDTLTAGIREVVTTDPDKLAVLCGRLRQLVDEFKPDQSAGGLAPPLHHFEWELDSLRRVVFRASGTLMGMDRGAWEERIHDLEGRAKTAYEEADGVGWRRICNEVQALRETAHQEEFAALRLDDPAYVGRRLLSAVHRANDVERELRDFVPAQADEVKALQLAERDRLLGVLDKKVSGVLSSLSADNDPNNLRRQLEAVAAELDRIETAIERMPSLGVVAEHGGR